MSSREVTLAKPTEWHRERWTEFTQLELDTKGPDPHMAILAGANPNPWKIGLYVERYGLGSAAALLQKFPEPEAALATPPAEIEAWLKEHADGLPIRRERRAVFSHAKCAESIRDLATWVKDKWPKVQAAATYEEAWQDNGVKFFGRYATIKYLEALRRFAGFPHAMPDIRAAGAWSPCLTLSILEGRPELNEAKVPEVEAVAAKWLANTQATLVGHQLDFFRFETLLCNYRQALEGKYPGRPHDTELKYWLKAERYWGKEHLEAAIPFYATRAELFDHRFLGELNGWDAPREILEDTAVKHNYFWSDRVYNFHASKADLSKPVKWETA